MDPRDRLEQLAADIWYVLVSLSRERGNSRDQLITGMARHVFRRHRLWDSTKNLTNDEIVDMVPPAEMVLVILKTLRAVENHR